MRLDIAAGKILQLDESEKAGAKFLFATFKFEALRQKINSRSVVAL